MTGLLSELGKRLAERWLSLLVLPGALYLAIAVAAQVLGHRHPFDLALLTERITTWAKAPAVDTVGGQVVLLAAVSGASATVGVVAQALGAGVEQRLLAIRPPVWLPRRLACLFAPTWCGRRMLAAAMRMEDEYRLNLNVIWPHLWLVLPDSAREEIHAVRAALNRATALGAWACLYALLSLWWWPAAAVGVGLWFTGWLRTRTATDAYALLLEATTSVYAVDLAAQLRLEAADGPLDRDLGSRLTTRLKGHADRSGPPR